MSGGRSISITGLVSLSVPEKYIARLALLKCILWSTINYIRLRWAQEGGIN